MHIDVHLQSGNISVYWLWLLLDVSVVSVGIVIISICDMPKREFSLCERVYIHNTYMKSRKSCSETRRKFQVKFPGRPVPNPSKIRRQRKRFKETGSVKNRKVNRRRHVLRRETLDEIGEKLEHTLKISKTFITGNWSICAVCIKSNKITEITYTIVNIHTFTQWEFLSGHVTNCNNHNHYTYCTNI